MSRSVGGALGILLVATALANGREDGPPLTPPAQESAAEAATPPPTPKSAVRRPFLGIPGVNTPPAATDRTARAPEVDSVPDPVVPPLAGPAARSEPIAPKVTMPLTLEPIPEGEDADGRPKVPASAKPRGTTPAPAPPAENGGSRFFSGSTLGRILGFDDDRNDAEGAISVESRSDPAVDAAVKRRIEKAVRESLGDRASAVEVRVKGRSVVIRARASRFWHRRGVRRALDSFQLPSGYHGRAELID